MNENMFNAMIERLIDRVDCVLADDIDRKDLRRLQTYRLACCLLSLGHSCDEHEMIADVLGHTPTIHTSGTERNERLDAQTIVP
jgi:hypothetical protein